MSIVQGAGRGVMLFGAAAAVLAGVGLCAGSASGQIRVSGLEHMPIGGATFDPPVERRLPVRNLGSSGEDGVEVRLNSRWGGSVSIDLDELLIPSPAEREVRIRPKGWDGTVKGSVRVASRPPDGTPGSSLDLECDLTAVGASTVRVRLRDQAGNTAASRVVAASSVQCVVQVVLPPDIVVPTCSVAIKTKGTGAESNRVITIGFGASTASVSGLFPATLHEVSSMEFEPETCSACDTWLGTESLLVTAGGVSQCVVSDVSVGTFAVSSHAIGVAHVDEMCANVADCDNARRIRVNNLGSSGQDGVAIDLHGGAVGGGAGGGSGGAVTLRKGELSGHVTLMKAFDDEGAETGRVSNHHDTFQNRQYLEYLGIEAGADEVTVSLRDAADLEIVRHTIPGPHHAVRVVTGAPGVEQRWSCHSGRWGMEFPIAFTIELGDGTVHGGVRSVHFLPSGGSSLHRCRELHVLANAAAEPVEVLSVDPAAARVRFDGLAVEAVGAAVMSHTADGALRVASPCCLGSSGEDGVEVHMRSQFGASVGLDVAPLRGASSSSAQVRIRRRGWDGAIYGNHRMSSVPGVPDAIDLTLDYSAMGATGYEWVAVREGGRTVGAGQVSEIVVRIIPNGGGGGGGGGGPAVWRAIGTKGTGIKLYDEFDFGGEVCLVTGLGASPLTDVVALRVQPIECPGCAPWVDLESTEVTFQGMESMDLHGTALHTFDVSCRGVDGASLMEWDDQGQITMKVDTSYSSVPSGVSMDWVHAGGQSAPGAQLSVAAGNCCRGHVIIMKAFDDEGGEAMRVAQSSDAGGASHTMEFDWSARAGGPFAATVTLSNGDGATLAQFAASGPTHSLAYVGPCDASAPRRVRCDGPDFEIEVCDAPVTVFAQGMPVANVRSVRVTVQDNGTLFRGIEITGNPTDYLEISGFAVIEPPACAADFDGNGTREVGDIFAFLSAWFAGQPAAVNFGGTPGVPAIFAFLTVWFAGCP
ncbi:MAG: hypothetical protein KF869_09815 [Phycisphaeraceae bacterium]|nr:hypothetical protein [Phycisphaeraceae bacterium]